MDAVVTALRDVATIKLPALPRMADFAIWATAAELALGWERGTFLSAYQGNRESANEVALEASCVARPLLEVLEEHGVWSGTAGELLNTIEGRVNDQVKRQNAWPKNARSMSGHLKRLAPNLRAGGWQISFHREAKQRLVVIERMSPNAPLASDPPVQESADRGDLFVDDAGDGGDADFEAISLSAHPNGDGWVEGEL